ncbi:MAG: hypothetical protein SFY69_06560 [Planctomycetota bacterium]|nr:hypothetical protein [Planctomycetota bacterium]
MSEQQPGNQGLDALGSVYPPQAFQFIRDGLAHTVKTVHGSGEGDDERRHVTGQQLCLGLKDYAIRQYGLLARTVLRSWNIHGTEDFGKIVFAMIEADLMRKSDEDTFDDFRRVYDFDEAFGEFTFSG